MKKLQKLFLRTLVILERNAHYKSGKDIAIPFLIDLLISNNFSSMIFLVIGRQSISLYDSPGP